MLWVLRRTGAITHEFLGAQPKIQSHMLTLSPVPQPPPTKCMSLYTAVLFYFAISTLPLAAKNKVSVNNMQRMQHTNPSFSPWLKISSIQKHKLSTALQFQITLYPWATCLWICEKKIAQQ